AGGQVAPGLAAPGTSQSKRGFSRGGPSGGGRARPGRRFPGARAARRVGLVGTEGTRVRPNPLRPPLPAPRGGVAAEMTGGRGRSRAVEDGCGTPPPRHRVFDPALLDPSDRAMFVRPYVTRSPRCRRRDVTIRAGREV